MSYNDTNRHQRDALISFDSASHTYTHDGRQFTSVTRVVERHFEQFDADYWAARKAPAMGLTPEQLKAQWARKGEQARNLGTMMHEKIERYYLGLPNDSDETYRLFEQFASQHHLEPFRTEWAIYDEESDVAGTLDFLACHNGVFTIYDWKRSNKVIIDGQPERESRWGKHAFAPIEHVPDTTFWHYALQVSIYRYILEKRYDIQVASGHLVVLHPDNTCPYVVAVPYMKAEVQALLRGQK